MHAFLNTASNVARQAGRLLVREFDQLSNASDRHQASITVYQQAQLLIVEALQQAYPQHGLIANGVTHQIQAEYVWQIDAINGFANYQHNIPHFAIVLSVSINGRVEHCLIHDPLLDESFSASRGGKAQKGNQRLRVSSQEKSDASSLFANTTNDKFSDIASRNTGCPALMLAYTAAGRFDAFIGYDLSAIEIACGCLLMKTAGGLYGDFSGGEQCQNAGMLAANPKLFKQLLKQK